MWVLCVAVAGFPRSVSAQQAPPSFPVTVQQAVQYAVDNYPAVRASMARIAAQESGVDLARTSYLPRLDSSLQINRATRNNVAGLLLPGTTIPPISGPVSDATSASSIWGSAGGLLLSWEAFDFGARGASVDLARRLVTRANASAELTRLEVGVKTADAFLRLATAQETVRAARANVERQQVFSNAVATLVRNQLRPGADDSRAQAEMALARIQLIQAEQAEQVARAGLAQWLGVAPADVRIVSDPLLAMPPPLPAAAPAVATHPLAETQTATVDSSRAIQQVLGRSYFPRVNVQTAYSLRGTGATAGGTNLGGTRGLDCDTSNWAVGLTATFPLFDVFALVLGHNTRTSRRPAGSRPHSGSAPARDGDRVAPALCPRGGCGHVQRPPRPMGVHDHEHVVRNRSSSFRRTLFVRASIGSPWVPTRA
jgi:outer membrane protein TolC